MNNSVYHGLTSIRQDIVRTKKVKKLREIDGSQVVMRLTDQNLLLAQKTIEYLRKLRKMIKSGKE